MSTLPLLLLFALLGAAVLTDVRVRRIPNAVVFPGMLAAFKVVVAIGLMVWAVRSRIRLERVGLALVAGGAALDTAIDRILAAFPARPHIFNLGHGIVPDTPIAHVEHLIKRVRGG